MIEAYEGYINKVVDRFNNAVKFLWVDQLTGQKLLEIETSIREKPKVPDGFWKKWPMSPTSFPLYMRAGYSALDVATKWPDAILGSVGYGRITTLQRGSRYCRDLTEEQSKLWIDAAIRQASEHTDMACSGIDRFREVELLRTKIEVEYLQFIKEFPPKKTPKRREDKPVTKWVRTHRHKYNTNKKAVEAYIELYGGSLGQLYEIDLKNDLRQNPLSKPKKSD